jgi:hypothetical protein
MTKSLTRQDPLRLIEEAVQRINLEIETSRQNLLEAQARFDACNSTRKELEALRVAITPRPPGRPPGLKAAPKKPTGPQPKPSLNETTPAP